MRIFFTIQFVFLLSQLSFAQSEVVSLLEKQSGMEIGLHFKQEPFNQKFSDGKAVIEYFNFINEGLPGTPILPSKTYFIALPPHSQVRIQLTEQKYSFIKNSLPALNPEMNLSNDSSIIYNESQPDLTKFTSDQYPDSEIEVIGYTWLRDYYCTIVRINTHSYNWKKREIRELLSATMNYEFSEHIAFNLNERPVGEFDNILKKVILNYKVASKFRVDKSEHSVSDTSGNWIDYASEYAKLQIPDDGIYRIGYDEILSYGINPSSINPKSFKIFSKGDEIPIYVSGESDLSFDPGDFVEFWAQKNYGSDDYGNIVSVGVDYLNYLDRYSDTSIVWLKWDGVDGKRISIQNTTATGLTDTLFSHKAFSHLEEDVRLWYYDAVSPRVQLPQWQENKVWTWQFLGNGGSIDFNFTATDFAPNAAVNVVARMISNATDQLFTNNHRFGLSLNSASPLDTIVFSYKQTVNFPGEYNSNQLVTGNNFVRIFGMQNDSLRWHQALIDWVDIEYQRFNVADNDSLLIRVDENTATSERVVKVSNVTQQSGDMLVYKIKPSFKKITSFNITNSVLTFTDTVAANDEYIVIKQSLTETPIFQKKKFFINLRDSNRGADYIAITNRILQSSAEQYIDFINNNYETRNELIYVDDIYDEFSFGCAKPEAIKDFLYFANKNWIAPAPSFLMLLGDANYDYKNKITPPPTVLRKNLVPSFGNPVSDVWFTMWDSSNVNIPQMFVGRIPATMNSEVQFYLNKHQTYLSRRFDDFNKRYLFFSGGDANNPSQLELLNSANSSVLNNFVQPAPVGGEGIHFYKTVNPLTNFGPYTREQVDNAIDSSGLFISYIGHSGTETWDNGITEVTDLKPAFNDRLSLISDFGCSTGKFAEPDVDAFGELFISASSDGQAIYYLGNSSWGYVSTSVNYPQLFYGQLLLKSLPVVSEIHYLAKLQLFNLYGTGDVNKVFNYCNILFGDPLIGFKLPPKPNLSITNNSFSIDNNFPLDINDSVQVNIELINFGKVLQDSVLVTIIDDYLGNQIFLNEFKIPVPLYKQYLRVNVQILGLVGEHNLQVTIDKDNFFDEIYKDDNTANYSFLVYASSIRPIEAERFYNTAISDFRFLNPVLLANQNVSSIEVSFADNPDFMNAFEFVTPMDTVKTIYRLNSLQSDKRYWWRARLNTSQASWSEPYSFFNEIVNYDWYFNRSFNYSDIQFNNLVFDSTAGNWRLTDYENILKVGSAGSDDGEFGSIKINGDEKLPNTFYWGIATAIIDSVTLEPSDFRYFLFWDPAPADSLISYINSLSVGTLLAMTICADGAQSVLGWTSGTPVRQAIETLGSLYIDSVFYRDSWCMIGKKGAPQGSVLESFKKRFQGRAEIETSNTVTNQNGWIEFPQIKNSAEWLSVTKADSLPTGSQISYLSIGIKSDNSIDTLSTLTFSGNIADISSIDANVYNMIKLVAMFQTNQNFESPSLKNIGVNFIPVPDLAINYQVVSVSNDSVLIGEDKDLSFYIYNVGESMADSFNVKVEVINEDNSRQSIFTQKVDSLIAGGRKLFEITQNTSSGSGAKTFFINIDSDNKVRELFEDNNFFSIPFYIKEDTTKPSITLTIDGNDILDGEYVAPNPTIHIELNDQSLLPIAEPNSVMIYLNDELIPSDTSVINYTFSETNPKVTVEFNPKLVDGEYALRVLWKDYEGNIVDSSGVEKFFLVSNEAKILNVYNYPNPSRGETHFTFKLTQLPEEIRIKIFTIAGRLVREIKLTSADLKYDFNKIYWDGRDEDGDVLANGVYLYKVIMQAGDKTEEVTQKLAIVK
ncbi:MAG: hypothetical protein IH618_12535 [Ignavibacteriaceae bacterium]|nr:hypothetical protein [Ignavibacteriaceae bacterium]